MGEQVFNAIDVSVLGYNFDVLEIDFSKGWNYKRTTSLTVDDNMKYTVEQLINLDDHMFNQVYRRYEQLLDKIYGDAQKKRQVSHIIIPIVQGIMYLMENIVLERKLIALEKRIEALENPQKNK